MFCVETCTPLSFSCNSIIDKILYEDEFCSRIICVDNISIKELQIRFKGINHQVEIQLNVIVGECLHVLCFGNNWCEEEENITIVSVNCCLSGVVQIIGEANGGKN